MPENPTDFVKPYERTSKSLLDALTVSETLESKAHPLSTLWLATALHMSAVVSASIAMLPRGTGLPLPTWKPTSVVKSAPTSTPTPRFSVKMNVEHAVTNG
jgi:hypothetical protein